MFYNVQNLVESTVVLKINGKPYSIASKKSIEVKIPKRAKVLFPKGKLEITEKNSKTESEAKAKKEFEEAEEAKAEALRLQEIADKEAEEASKAKEIADKEALEALEAKKLADEAEQKAKLEEIEALEAEAESKKVTETKKPVAKKRNSKAKAKDVKIETEENSESK